METIKSEQINESAKVDKVLYTGRPKPIRWADVKVEHQAPNVPLFPGHARQYPNVAINLI